MARPVLNLFCPAESVTRFYDRCSCCESYGKKKEEKMGIPSTPTGVAASGTREGTARRIARIHELLAC